MSDNLMVGTHKYSNKSFQDGYRKILKTCFDKDNSAFGRRCPENLLIGDKCTCKQSKNK